MKLHNTLTRSVDQFTPQNDQAVTLYSCGPTVYDYPHIGNWTAYVRWDILARTLRANKYNLNWYMNITDVGHLVSDADDGEDKLEKGAKREGKSAWEIAAFYTNVFIKGLNDLSISVSHDKLVKATDHIDEQIELISQLEAKGFTYTIDDGVYFDSTKFAGYGTMARLDIEGLQAGARVDIGHKKHGSDFALWKFSPASETRDMQWPSPWGVGFPGWHIECSAMAMKYLGTTIDIHTGGIDHIPVHHTNEIAQSEAATGQQFVRFWLHSNFLQVEGTKISKSLGNVYRLEDIYDKGFTAQDFRMFVLQSQYQTESNFTWEGLEAAKHRLASLRAVADLRFQPNAQQNLKVDYQGAIQDALNDNLNTPKALSELSGLVTTLETHGLPADAVEAYEALLEFIDTTLGFDLLSSQNITAEQKDILERRTQARDSKDWALSDSLRDQLLTQGIGINDTPRGSVWYRV